MNDDATMSTLDTYLDDLEDQRRDEYVTYMDNILKGGESLDSVPGWLLQNPDFLHELMSQLTERKYGRKSTFEQELKLLCIKQLLN